MINKKNNKLGWLLTSPYLIFTAVIFLIPLGFALWLSFTDWDMMSPNINFVGLDNFIEAVKSPGVHAAFFVTYKFLIVFVPLVLLLSMLIAMLVNALPEFKGLYLVAFFLPYLSSGVVTSLIVNGLLSYNGTLNRFLRNHFNIQIDWLGNPNTALIIISLMIAWKMSGYYALILHSGLENINKTLYEAAAIDGATRKNMFFQITIPMLYPALITVMILAIGITFGIFTEVYQLTGGGPNNATNTWQMEIYKEAFISLESGYASSISLISSVITFMTVGVFRKIIQKWGESNGWT